MLYKSNPLSHIHISAYPQKCPQYCSKHMDHQWVGAKAQGRADRETGAPWEGWRGRQSAAWWSLCPWEPLALQHCPQAKRNHICRGGALLGQAALACHGPPTLLCSPPPTGPCGHLQLQLKAHCALLTTIGRQFLCSVLHNSCGQCVWPQSRPAQPPLACSGHSHSIVFL